MDGMTHVVDFRGRPACPCLAAWLPVYEAELQRRGLLEGPLSIYQLIGGAEASGGTHANGGAFDLVDLPGAEDVWVARQMGADATWARTPAQGFIAHLHGVLRGCGHNGPAAYQITSSTLGVDAGWNGLSGNSRGRDDGPRPLSGRTWREGIAWATQQQEEDMNPESVQQIVDAMRPVIREELAKVGDTVKIDVGTKAKRSLATVLKEIRTAVTTR
jgi:hypothetical protein